jgi:hypothetical protein
MTLDEATVIVRALRDLEPTCQVRMTCDDRGCSLNAVDLRATPAVMVYLEALELELRFQDALVVQRG